MCFYLLVFTSGICQCAFLFLFFLFCCCKKFADVVAVIIDDIVNDCF